MSVVVSEFKLERVIVLKQIGLRVIQSRLI